MNTSLNNLKTDCKNIGQCDIIKQRKGRKEKIDVRRYQKYQLQN